MRACQIVALLSFWTPTRWACQGSCSNLTQTTCLYFTGSLLTLVSVSSWTCSACIQITDRPLYTQKLWNNDYRRVVAREFQWCLGDTRCWEYRFHSVATNCEAIPTSWPSSLSWLQTALLFFCIQRYELFQNFLHQWHLQKCKDS